MRQEESTRDDFSPSVFLTRKVVDALKGLELFVVIGCEKAAPADVPGALLVRFQKAVALERLHHAGLSHEVR